jgi:hypothetical protein
LSRQGLYQWSFGQAQDGVLGILKREVLKFYHEVDRRLSLNEFMNHYGDDVLVQVT